MSLFLRTSDTAAGTSGGGIRRRAATRVITVAAALTALGFAGLAVLAPPPQTTASAFEQELRAAQQTSAAEADGQQTLHVPGDAAGSSVIRDGYGASSGLANLSKGSTNRDWAVLVLYMADFPTSDSNITVMLRWMRQENGPDDWWLRNNPLNNGWGSGGGSGLGSYDTLVTAAENVGNALHGNSGYAAIVAGFEVSAPTAQIESAIWASPWASSHYGNGSHWSYSPVPVIASPAGTWG